MRNNAYADHSTQALLLHASATVLHDRYYAVKTIICDAFVYLGVQSFLLEGGPSFLHLRTTKGIQVVHMACKNM